MRDTVLPAATACAFVLAGLTACGRGDPAAGAARASADEARTAAASARASSAVARAAAPSAGTVAERQGTNATPAEPVTVSEEVEARSYHAPPGLQAKVQAAQKEGKAPSAPPKKDAAQP